MRTACASCSICALQCVGRHKFHLIYQKISYDDILQKIISLNPPCGCTQHAPGVLLFLYSRTLSTAFSALCGVQDVRNSPRRYQMKSRSFAHPIVHNSVYGAQDGIIECHPVERYDTIPNIKGWLCSVGFLYLWVSFTTENGFLKFQESLGQRHQFSFVNSCVFGSLLQKRTTKIVPFSKRHLKF